MTEPPPKERLPDAPHIEQSSWAGGTEVESGEETEGQVHVGQTRPEPTREDETGAHQGGADETGAHQGGADETGAHQGGAYAHGRDWDLKEIETQEAERAHIVSKTEAGSLSGHGRSGASGSHDGSGDSMGHGEKKIFFSFLCFLVSHGNLRWLTSLLRDVTGKPSFDWRSWFLCWNVEAVECF